MLEVAGLHAWYGDSHVLQGVELSVGDGARVAVVGRNGAGKSTLFKSVLNAGPRIEGRVAFDGHDLGTLAAFRRARLGLSLVPEDRRIFPHLTVLENLSITRHAAIAGRDSLPPTELLTAFPMLGPLTRRLGTQLSGGQQQMLAVARGFLPRPRLLLLDEPTEGLAPVIVQQLARAVVDLCAANGTALLLSEQNLWFARHCTDRVHVLDSGRVVFEGDWAAFDAQPEIKNRYLAV